MDQLRLAAFTRCRDRGIYYALWRLTKLGFNADRYIVGEDYFSPAAEFAIEARFEDADIHADMQYCGSSLNFEIQSEGETVSEGYLGRGGTPGLQIVETGASSPLAGALTFSGTLHAHSCWLPAHRYPVTPDHLTVRLDGVTIIQIPQEAESERRHRRLHPQPRRHRKQTLYPFDSV